ncbi:hypothetical protein DKX38_017556 [Salix brachista]|uniref:Transmembrane protein n=1 Tax=Salix brachista TaxID=2182728 RepID=A0A5N5KVK5_9ROSI|nr:hypothetical protein DKX38_017556 [Salix brachista]
MLSLSSALRGLNTGDHSMESRLKRISLGIAAVLCPLPFADRCCVACGVGVGCAGLLLGPAWVLLWRLCSAFLFLAVFCREVLRVWEFGQRPSALSRAPPFSAAAVLVFFRAFCLLSWRLGRVCCLACFWRVANVLQKFFISRLPGVILSVGVVFWEGSQVSFFLYPLLPLPLCFCFLLGHFSAWAAVVHFSSWAAVVSLVLGRAWFFFA